MSRKCLGSVLGGVSEASRRCLSPRTDAKKPHTSICISHGLQLGGLPARGGGERLCVSCTG